MNVGIIGSRRRNSLQDFEKVHGAFQEFLFVADLSKLTIISGGCPKGGDRFAEVLAKKYKVDIIIHRAEWNKYGRSAGFQRNTYIAQDSDVLIACAAPDRTGGTEDTIRKFKKLHPEGLVTIV